MKKIYRLSKVTVVAGFERIDVDAEGGEEVKTNQVISYNKLYTPEQFLEIMKAKIEPGEKIECDINPELLK